MSSDDEILQSEKDEPVEIGDVEGTDTYILQAEIESILKEAEVFRLQKMSDQQSRQFTSLFVMLASVVLGAGAFAWYLLVEGNIGMAILCMLIAVIPHFFLNTWVQQPIKEYKSEYKGTFMTRLAKTFGKFEYFQKRGITRKTLSKTAIVPAHGEYRAEDCFYGTRQGAKITLSEARLTHKNNKNAMAFDGIFALIEFKEPKFEGHSVITADPGLAKRLSQKMKLAKPKDSSYGRSFTTLSTADPSAQSFLTHALYEKLDLVKVKFDSASISAALFAKKYIFLMIPNEKDMFEASDMYVPVASNEAANRCRREVEQLLSIMEVAEAYTGDKTGVIDESKIVEKMPETPVATAPASDGETATPSTAPEAQPPASEAPASTAAEKPAAQEVKSDPVTTSEEKPAEPPPVFKTENNSEAEAKPVVEDPEENFNDAADGDPTEKAKSQPEG